MNRLPLVGEFRPALLSRPTRDALLRGSLVFRWAVYAWVLITFIYEVIDRGNANTLREANPPVAHPYVGFGLYVLLAVSLIWLTVLYFKSPAKMLKPAPVLFEIAVSALMLGLDSWVYGTALHTQSLPSVYPVTSIFMVGMAAGTGAALATGFGFAVSFYVGWLFGWDNDSWFGFGHIADGVMFCVTAGVSAYLLEKMVLADRSISAFRAREEVARTLHDGVLQTLAVIQRRSDDDDLKGLARVQENELREYLFKGSVDQVDLGAALRECARKAEERYGYRVQVIAAPDLDESRPEAIHALSGAVTEALTNAHKHGAAAKVVVYAEPADEEGWKVFVSVKDDGSGFETSEVRLGEGLKRSITARVQEAGGQVKIDGRPGRGTEVKLWL